MTRRLVILAAILVVGVGVIFLSKRSTGPNQGAEGTIGAANRYTAQQISDKDVALKDADVQAFLQSDLFHKMTIDPEFRKVALSDECKRVTAAGGEGVFRVLALPVETQRALSTNRVQQILASNDCQKLLANGDFQALAAMREFQQLMGNGDFQKIASAKAFSELMRNSDYRRMLDAASVARITAHEYQAWNRSMANSYGKVLNSVQYKQLAEQNRLQDLEANPLFRELADKPEFQRALDLPEFGRAFDMDAFRALCSEDGALMRNLASPDMGRVLSDQAAVQVLRSSDYQTLARSDAFQQLMRRDDAAAFFRSAQLGKVWQSDAMARALSTAGN
jgi:hypothetical protein